MGYSRWLPTLKEEVAREYEKAPRDTRSVAHGMDHLDRVWDRCEELGARMGADMEVLIAAAYLHDIGRQYGLELHGQESAKHANGVLERIGFPKGKVPAVLHVIEKHDYQTAPAERKTTEARILYDADKLDAFGDAGIKRYTGYYLGKWTPAQIVENIDRRWGTLELPESKEVGKADYLKVRKHFEKML